MKRHYPKWTITRSLDEIFNELVESWSRRAEIHSDAMCGSLPGALQNDR
jgi:hypothetical protein